MTQTNVVPCFPELSRNKITIQQYQLPCLINNAISQSIDHSSTTKYRITALKGSVSCTKPWQSEMYWVVRRWHIITHANSPKSANSVLNPVLPDIEVYYYHMIRKEQKQKELSGSRFGTMIFFLRMAGIQCKMKKVSTVYTVYTTTLIMCASATYLGMFVYVYNNMEDLGRAMTSFRVFISVTNVMWVFWNLR